MPLNWPMPVGQQGQAATGQRGWGAMPMRGNNWPQPIPSSPAAPTSPFQPSDTSANNGFGSPGPARDTSGDGAFTTPNNSAPTYQALGNQQAVLPKAPPMQNNLMQRLGGMPPGMAARLAPFIQQLMSGRNASAPAGMAPASASPTGWDYGGRAQFGGGTGNALPAYTTQVGGAAPAGYTSDWRGAGAGAPGNALPAYSTSLPSQQGGYAPEGAPRTPQTAMYGGGAGNMLPAFTTDMTTLAPQGYTSDYRSGAPLGGGAGSTLPGFGVGNPEGYSIFAPQTSADYRGNTDPWAL